MDPNLRWDMVDMPWEQFRPECVVNNLELRYMLCMASFIEITTELYTRNLADCFSDDPVVSAWLRDEWEVQEMQHGRALREYVQRAWPDFDWKRRYEDFYAEFAPLSAPEFMMPTRGLEMVSRCVVEMGTSSYYTALNRATDEPVLQWLTRNIYQDEIAHYKHFLRYFHEYRERDSVTRWQVASTLFKRLKMIEAEDSFIAMKHVHAALAPGEVWNRRVYRRIMKRIKHVASRHLPLGRSVKMLLRPLDATPRMQRLLLPALTGVAKIVV